MANKWTTVTFGEIANLAQGLCFNAKTNHLMADSGIPLLRIADLINNTQTKFVDAERVPKKFVAVPEDIIYTRTGQVGLVFRGKVGVVHNNCFRVIPKEGIDRDYLYWYLRLPSVVEKARSLAGGAAQPDLGHDAFKSISFSYPEPLEQRRIAGILSAYDELIENSQRRIKILEAMARALYREWFVEFRFPGHESVHRVPSPLGEIPKGWEVSTLGAHLAALESGKRPKGGIRGVEDGVPSIGAENIKGIGQHDFAGEKFIPREFFLKMRKGIVRDRDVAVYKDGAYIGKSSYFRDGFPYVECCVNEHVFLLRATGERLKQNALYLWLQEPDTLQRIRSKNTNAAQPGINQKTVGGLELPLPESQIAEQFDRVADPLFAEIINLAKKMQNLRCTRDLLLPRLLSGEIALEA